jgi:hypothetical protein
MTIDPTLLRLLWIVIEDMQSQDLLTLSDTALAAVLLQQVSRRILLGGEEVCSLYAYVGSRLSLIRDIADCRCSEGLSFTTNYQSTAPTIVSVAE